MEYQGAAWKNKLPPFHGVDAGHDSGRIHPDMSGDRSCSSLEDWNDRWDQWDDQYSDFEVRVNSWPKGDTPTGVSLITTHQ